MDIEQARDAKRNMTSVYATEDGTMDTAHHGIIVQIGFHESGRNDLVAIEGQYGLKWFPLGAIRLHPREEEHIMAEFTDHDLRNQVAESLGSEGADFDIEGIVSEIQAAYGTVPIDQVPHAIYWGIVERHDNTLTEAALTDQGRADG